ncbi:phage tail protein [Thiohalocapsa halophila]|uniref:Phage tail protein n=2 Tax=Thiohalocapsa halophila TaxID=69359 RepID=A0ABS1CL39_9GAMM|nr:phage tail protein [Thiohalocapsa halophila]
MATFNVNTHRHDPYKNFKFRVRWDGRTIAGITKVSGLKRTTEVKEFREGGEVSSVHKLPGRHSVEPIRLERGITHDAEFERWANKVWNVSAKEGGGLESSLKDFRKDIIIDLLNEAGQIVLCYKVYRCWVSEFQALPELDANGNGVAIEALTLQNEGWERDQTVPEPAEPSYDDPPVT